MNADNLEGTAIVPDASCRGASAMLRRQEPIEGATDSQAATPTRTGDDVPASVIASQEAKTMGAIPFLFGETAALIAAIVMVLFIVFR